MLKYGHYWCTFYPSSDDEVKVRFAGIAAERVERSIVHEGDALLQIAALNLQTLPKTQSVMKT